MSIKENVDRSPSKEVLIAMLGSALVQIRASDDLKLIRGLADIFHNLPPHLAYKWGETSNIQAYETILKKASQRGLKNYILKLRDSTEKTFDV